MMNPLQNSLTSTSIRLGRNIVTTEQFGQFEVPFVSPSVGNQRRDEVGQVLWLVLLFLSRA